MTALPSRILAALCALTLYGGARAAAPRPVTAAEQRVLAAKADLGLTSFPIGFWNYTSLDNAEHLAHQQEADVEQWHQAGFTLAITPFFQWGNAEQRAHITRMLDWAQARDMKLIVTDGRRGGDPVGDAAAQEAYRRQLSDALADFGAHPATFGLFIGDEPGAALNASFCRAAKVQREMAPQLTPFLNLFPWWPEGEALVGATDGWPAYLDRMIQEGELKVLCYDHYAQLVDPAGVEGYFANLRLHRDAALRNGIPFWTTLGCVGHWRYRVPTRDDLRWQFNTAVCSGASGILWFMYYMRAPDENYRMTPVDEFWETTRVYDDLRFVHRYFQRFYGDLFNRLVSTKVMFYPDGRGGFPGFSADDLIRRVAISSATAYDGSPGALMIGEFVDAAGSEYLMVVNASQTNDVQARLELNIAAEMLYRPGWYGGEEQVWNVTPLDTGGIAYTQWLAPGQEMLFHIVR